MSDIAAQIGVSTVTVSKALSDKDGVSEQMRERIKQKAAEMGYRFSGSSKNSKGSLNYSVSVIVANRFINDSAALYWVIYRHLVEFLQKHSYYGILEVVNESDEELCGMPKSITEKKSDGMIVLGQFSQSYVNALVGMDFPVVFLDFYTARNDIDTVLSDNFFGAYTITNHLFSCGHRRIGFIGSVNATSSIQDRYLGYYKAHMENRTRMNSAWVIEDRNQAGVMFREFALPRELPAAFVCNCDEAAYILINQLKAHGMRVPEDISVVGYDNHIYSTISNPGITTIDVNSSRMSYEAVEIMLKKIRDPDYRSGRVLVTGELIERNSVKKLR